MHYQDILRWIESNPLVYRLAIAIVLVFASFPLGWLFKKAVRALRSRIFSRTNTDLDERLAEVLEKRAKSIVFAILSLYALWEIQTVSAERSVVVERLIKIVDAIIYIYAAIVAISVALGFIRVTIDYLLEESAKSQRQDAKQLMTIAPLARNLTAVVVILVAAAIVMEHFSINVGSLLVSLGVGSLAVALAAQDTLANIIAGVIIAIDQPFRVGDRIRLPNGTLADVKVIGLRSTRILDFDNNYLIVPNSELIKSAIVNLAYPTHKVRVLVPFTLPFGTDTQKVREIALNVMRSHRFVTDDPPPALQAMRVTELGLEVRLACFVEDFSQSFDAEIELREELHRALSEAGIELAVPRRVVRAEKESDITIRGSSEINGARTNA
ncbi:MAG: mechanosensitive ion channel family protein [Chloroherpetonaceae bacterium]|nr:mechanosensitive ion channel family protein [Chloroherpetonaceae bacterium]MDW8438419.1 mechanosensitive ion channel family protein [Chloroherpetonaceae bacterium]